MPKKKSIQFDIVTIFPNVFSEYFNSTILARAQKKKLIKINILDLRKFAKKSDPHKSVDDRPYGGGPGMILMFEPIAKALKSIKRTKKARIIMTAPEGKKLTQKEAKRLSQYDQLIILCGRYEGFDSRVEELIDEKISIGKYVLAGGELPAMVITETVARHVPGVVGHDEALTEETFSKGDDYVEYPQYTRPETVKHGRKKLSVPKVLLSGDHAKIKDWRDKNKKK
ncbi:MAG: tRNA (guanosine(37)-N1)-methyltransferase TrmD [Candidatus Buchananbacteria bacterium CG10_big_fil_rev_8_21_14_0_10_42_9]|uniref:tRNA (guanine-N(1)-)-methyltransferase n=1 Tax=Candidatus Buchananbacteria bacterium CG10_big_fil_rev_8_21_14_0_10_42_9 TaxID=1974526 RepID=A0A2H0W0I7_9BACT|nr:MAG: tRNA (guanosine(37)-N1)-methyltransferase TrmD [Candidatus Buchananbacteria bacterium CG10_big_fil_rev_8_21_14_0_10_42_9]